jgi:hypothetical protein
MSVERGLSPPEQYEIGIKYLQQLMKEHPDNFGCAAPLIPKLKEEQKKVNKDWKYRGTSQEHRI